MSKTVYDYMDWPEIEAVVYGEETAPSKMNKAKLPTHIEISTRDYKIVKNSVILLEQIRTIDKQRLKEYVCHIDSAMMQKVDKAIRISLEIAT